MIIFLYGTDVQKIQLKTNAILDSLRKKKPNASFVRIDDEQAVESIDATLSGSGLFESNYIVLMRNVTRDKDVWKEVSKKIKALQQSSHAYIWIEESEENASIKKIKEAAEKSEEHILKIAKDEQVQVFVFLDLFFARNAKDSWVWYQNNKDVDLSQILNLIMWQIKSVVVADNSRDAAQAKLKPFVFSKAKKIASLWSSDELSQLFIKCIEWQTRARQGEDVAPEFEKYMLCV